MISAIVRSVGAIVLGLAVALLLVIGLEVFSAVVHPFPADFSGTQDEICAHVANYPGWVLAVVVPAWGVTTWISTWLATRVGTARHPAHGVAVGGVLLLAIVLNMYMLPYPLWFEVINLIVSPLAIYWGVKLGCQPSAAKPDPAL